ncbi:Glutamyl-tRNA (Gln) amidotransferase subunit A (DUF620) [Melia azedarach]|uniref:Glutamyl-tRNA (Gln) amidotransferase subunit A (DUF620) n=1 Tax=Melia azedarach TaxID=155640 RepID=A0ACC1WRN2_MELAZ|nr:Glutamyl-tRNA (Gln) amidotransferase subunit A (DUF620) [Melia azedarach]
MGKALVPLIEGSDSNETELGESKWIGSSLGNWVKQQLSRTPLVTAMTYKRSDMRLLLGVMGAPLASVHVSSNDHLPHLNIEDTPIDGSCREKSTRTVKNGNASSYAESSGFVLWQMNLDMWYFEIAVGGSKVHAGCNGKLVWRHAPWGSAHTTKGPARPLRRALQLFADPQTLKATSKGPVEIIRHVLFGYFSQKTGLLVHVEDSRLTPIQSDGGDAIYWETTISSFLDDYKPVEGIMIAHSGCSVVTRFRFREVAMSHTKTKMEEAWTIEEVAFNVPRLSIDCFIPPSDLRSVSISEARSLSIYRTLI